MARLTLKDRKTLARLYRAETPTINIAQKLRCSQTTVYNELERGFTGELDEFGRRVYDPVQAQRAVQEATSRQGCKSVQAETTGRDC